MSAALSEVATYSRRVRASAERVWENVHDWEHLPTLHAASFRSIRCARADANGWRAQIGLANGGEIALELSLESDRRSYHSRTVGGPGAGTDIFTRVTEVGAHATDIAVAFLAPNVPADAVSKLGAAFVQLYTRLWDEDEAMMQHRQAFLDGVAPRPPRPGARAEAVRPRRCTARAAAPRGGRRRRRLARARARGPPRRARRLACPHWGASLASARIEENAVMCPWHGYRFDLASGRGPAAQRCRMPARAEVRVTERGEAWLVIS